MRHLPLLLFAPLLSACVFVNGHPYGIGLDRRPGLGGSGRIETAVREPGDFHRIELELPAQVEVQVGDAPRVTLEGDDNLLLRIRTTVRDGKLTIDRERGRDLRFSRRLVVRITCRELDGFGIEGSGDARIRNVNAERFAVSIEGSGSVSVSGVARHVEASIEGSGDLSLDGLQAREASVSIEGSGNVGVRAAEALHYSIEGSGDIRYAGDPRVTGGIEGSGSVRRR